MSRRTLLTRAGALFMFAGFSFPSPAVSADSASADALHEAAAKNDVPRIQELLAAGVPLERRDNNGATPLLVATHANAVEAASALIAAGADVNAKDNLQDSPYLYAGARGHLQILKLTLAHGADLKSLNRYGGTALIPAAERGHVETVRRLIEAGVDVDHVNRLQWTALLEAILLGKGGPEHEKIVELLIQGGADVNLPDGQGITPLQHAQAAGYDRISQRLEAAGAR